MGSIKLTEILNKLSFNFLKKKKQPAEKKNKIEDERLDSKQISKRMKNINSLKQYSNKVGKLKDISFRELEKMIPNVSKNELVIAVSYPNSFYGPQARKSSYMGI